MLWYYSVYFLLMCVFMCSPACLFVYLVCFVRSCMQAWDFYSPEHNHASRQQYRRRKWDKLKQVANILLINLCIGCMYLPWAINSLVPQMNRKTVRSTIGSLIVAFRQCSYLIRFNINLKERFHESVSFDTSFESPQ